MTEKVDEQNYYLREEHLKKCFDYLRNAQNEVSLRFTNHKETDAIINETHVFIEEQMKKVRAIYDERFAK